MPPPELSPSYWLEKGNGADSAGSMSLPCPRAVVASTTISRTKVQPYISVIFSRTLLFRSGFSATAVSGLGGGPQRSSDGSAKSGEMSAAIRKIMRSPERLSNDPAPTDHGLTSFSECGVVGARRQRDLRGFITSLAPQEFQI